MATATNDSYTVASGSSVYAGRYPPKMSGDIVVAGDSLTALSYPSAPYRSGLPLARSPYRLVYNAGITNNTLNDLWARWQADVLDQNPGIVMLRIGTNSITTDVAAFMASYRRFTDSLLLNNIWGVIHAIPPRRGASAAIIPLNNALADLCATSAGRLRFTRDGIGLGDANYVATESMYSDGIHMNNIGQYVAGQSLAVDLANWFEPNDPRITDPADTYYLNSVSDQYVKNPFMAGSGGSHYYTTGTVPDFWGASCNGSGTTAACSIVPADAGDTCQVPWFRTDIKTIGASGHSVNVSTLLGHPAIAADLAIKRFDVIAEVRFALDTTLLNKLTMNVTRGGYMVGSGESMGLGGNGVINDTIILRSSYLRTQGGSALEAYAANAMSFGLSISTAGAATSSIGTFDIRCASVRGQGA